MISEDSESYKNFMRLSLTKLVEPKLIKSEIWMRVPLSPRLKLEVTLRYVTSGHNLALLQYLYRVPKCTISVFLPEVLSSRRLYKGKIFTIYVIFIRKYCFYISIMF